jgi:soluble lytic murein transglycosylase-like protein
MKLLLIAGLLLISCNTPSSRNAPLSPSEQRDSIVATEARRAGIPVGLAIAVSHVEDTSGDSMAVSPAGAVGIMQVLPKYWQHSFEDECGCGSLFRRQRNACVGTHILAQYRKQYPSWGTALRAYHGSHDHPAGHAYSDSVLAQVVSR